MLTKARNDLPEEAQSFLIATCMKGRAHGTSKGLPSSEASTATQGSVDLLGFERFQIGASRFQELNLDQCHGAPRKLWAAPPCCSCRISPWPEAGLHFGLFCFESFVVRNEKG